MIDTNKIQYSSAFSGFKNVPPDILFSTSYAGGSLTVGEFIGPLRATEILDNTNEISQVQVQFGGLETFSRLLPGFLAEDYPSQAVPQYQIEAFSYFKNGNIVVDFWIINQTAGSIIVPAITFSCNASLFVAPF